MPHPSGPRRGLATAGTARIGTAGTARIGTACAALALALAGCGAAPAASPGAPAATPAGAAAGAPAARVVLPASRPVALRIPAIDVDTTVMELGLLPDRTMEVPPDGREAGWYIHSPTPGELGPSVLAAHVDWQGEEGVFYDLRELTPGDEVQVGRADGTIAAFAVRSVEQYPKDRFPTEQVYGDVGTAQLRLITCGGDFDAAARSYRDNVVVYAELIT